MLFLMKSCMWRGKMNEQILNYIHDTGHVYYGAKAKILNLMKDEQYRSLMDIFKETEVEPTSASSILRQFRNKPEKYGKMIVNKKRDIDSGKWLYQLIVVDDEPQPNI